MSITPTRMPPMPKTKPPTNCRNCGAPLHGFVCEYCGTAYGDEQLYVKVDTTLSQEEMKHMVEMLKKHQADPVILLPNSLGFKRTR